MILIISASDDEHIALVTKHLDAEEIVCLFTDEIINYTYFTLSPDQLVVKLGGKDVPLNLISSVWYRKPKPVSAKIDDINIDQFITREWQMFLHSLYSSLHNAFWINPISANTAANAKLYQLQVARKIGFSIPDSIFTNDKKAALEFAKKHHVIALKVIDQVIVTHQNVDRYMYTKKLSFAELQSLAGFNISPVIIQEYIPKAYEIRATCVGNKIFSCRIDSQGDEDSRTDWRNGKISQMTHSQINLPSLIENQIKAMMKYFNLQFGAFDILVTPEKHHVFLELNPNGQWAWIELLTQMPIGLAIAQLLKKNGSL